jgi:hypothetical protein
MFAMRAFPDCGDGALPVGAAVLPRVRLAAGQEAHFTVSLLLDVASEQVIPSGAVSGGNFVPEPCGDGRCAPAGRVLGGSSPELVRRRNSEET